MPRPVLSTCGKLRVEVRPLALQLFRWPDYDGAQPLQISRSVRPLSHRPCWRQALHHCFQWQF